MFSFKLIDGQKFFSPTWWNIAAGEWLVHVLTV
jgi:hypothetical protein